MRIPSRTFIRLGRRKHSRESVLEKAFEVKQNKHSRHIYYGLTVRDTVLNRQEFTAMLPIRSLNSEIDSRQGAKARTGRTRGWWTISQNRGPSLQAAYLPGNPGATITRPPLCEPLPRADLPYSICVGNLSPNNNRARTNRSLG